MKDSPIASPASVTDRQQRQAEALRANLARRKTQTRARRDTAPEITSTTTEQQGTVDHGDHA